MKERNQHFPERMFDFDISTSELPISIDYEAVILNFCKCMVTLHVTKTYHLEIGVTINK